jgi:hypothetical protein
MSQVWINPFAPAVYAVPSISKVTQLKLVIFALVPNVPLANNLLVASAGFQNLISFKPTVQNLRSSGFLDHAQ